MMSLVGAKWTLAGSMTMSVLKGNTDIADTAADFRE
jgi:hypothetical protein